MRAFVTGATGFLGANLVAGLLARGVEVRILRRADSSLDALEGLVVEECIGDILDDTNLLAEAMAGCDRVYHVAGAIQYHGDPRNLYQTNVEGTLRIAQAASQAGVERLVFTSSLSAMGVSRGGRLLDETSRFNLEPKRFPYGHSKLLAEEALRERIREGLDAVIVNPGTVIGPRDVNKNAGAMILQAHSGRLRFYPPGGTNFAAASDVVAGHIAAAERGLTGERYILGATNHSYREIFSLVCRTLGKPAPKLPIPGWALPAASMGVRLFERLPGVRLPVDANQVRMSGRTIYADVSKARKVLGLPQTPLETAIREAKDWYAAHRDL